MERRNSGRRTASLILRGTARRASRGYGDVVSTSDSRRRRGRRRGSPGAPTSAAPKLPPAELRLPRNEGNKKNVPGAEKKSSVWSPITIPLCCRVNEDGELFALKLAVPRSPMEERTERMKRAEERIRRKKPEEIPRNRMRGRYRVCLDRYLDY